jgi:hypothetical protein
MPDSRSARPRSARRLALALLACLAWPASAHAQAGTRDADLEKREQTLRTLRALAEGIFGSGDSVGYLADMGALPTDLVDLAPAAGNPPYSTAHQGQVGMGYDGPYVARAGAPGQAFLDAWNTPIQLVTTATTAQLLSGGPDRDVATTTDNVVFPAAPRLTHGVVEVRVESVASDGTGLQDEDGGSVAVTVYYARNGAQTSALASESGGRFRASAMHLGPHCVVASALVPANFETASATDVVMLRGGKAKTALRLVRKAGGTTICHKPNSKNAKTMVVDAGALGGHTKHGDTLGACPTP